MGNHILIVNILARGHVLPTLAVVSELTRRGHRVTYVTVDRLAGMVEAAGATAVRYESAMADVSAGQMSGAEGVARVPLLFLEENVAILEAATGHVADGDRPDLVAYDISARHAGQVLAHRWDRPALQLCPLFASNEHFSLNQRMIESSVRGGAAVDRGHPALMEFFGKVVALLAENGMSDVPVPDFLSGPAPFTVAFLPRAFQYAGETFDDRYAFVGPCLGDRPFLGAWTPPPGDRPVVLVSQGTSADRDTGFFATCARAFAGTEWQVVMSVGARFDPSTLGALPDNVEVHAFVPHLAVLERASVFLTHGGMGSVMESLWSGTPMVVRPEGGDTLPTAQRVAELGLGSMVEPDEELTADRLVAEVTSVATDPDVRSRVAQMRSEVRAAGGAGRAADEIEAYLKRSR